MHAVTVFLGTGAWALLFKDEDRAKTIVSQLRDYISLLNVQNVEIIDDFGQALMVATKPHGWLHEDLELSKLARVEFALHQQRTQVLAQKMASSDSTLRQAHMMNGPAIIDPVRSGRPGF